MAKHRAKEPAAGQVVIRYLMGRHQLHPQTFTNCWKPQAKRIQPARESKVKKASEDKTTLVVAAKKKKTTRTLRSSNRDHTVSTIVSTWKLETPSWLHESQCSNVTTNSSVPYLNRMPIEFHLEIMDRLGPLDTVCLGLTSKKYWGLRKYRTGPTLPLRLDGVVITASTIRELISIAKMRTSPSKRGRW